MNVQSILAEIRNGGMTITLIDGDNLRVEPKHLITDQIRNLVRENKEAILTIVRKKPKVATKSDGIGWVRRHLAELREVGFSDHELFGRAYSLEQCLADMPAGTVITIEKSDVMGRLGGEVVARWRNQHGNQITQRAQTDGCGRSR